MKYLSTILSFFAFGISLAQGPFAPAANTVGTTAIHFSSTEIIGWATSSTIRRGWMDIADTALGKTTVGTYLDAIGSANGTVVSLGDSGEAVLQFDSPVVNGPGFDFAVFENSFSDIFLELAHVEVSSDGINFYRFPSVCLTQDTVQVDGFGLSDPTNIYNLAGKYRAQYGTPFDLEEMSNIPGLDVNNITHLKILDVIGTINPLYAQKDSTGHVINEPYPTPFPSGGFDLDAVGVMHSIAGEVEISSRFQLYPNPCVEKFTLRFNNVAQRKLEVHSIDGSLQWESFSSAVEIEVPTHFLSKGLYMVRVSNENQSSTQKLLIH